MIMTQQQTRGHKADRIKTLWRYSNTADTPWWRPDITLPLTPRWIFPCLVPPMIFRVHCKKFHSSGGTTTGRDLQDRKIPECFPHSPLISVPNIVEELMVPTDREEVDMIGNLSNSGYGLYIASSVTVNFIPYPSGSVPVTMVHWISSGSYWGNKNVERIASSNRFDFANVHAGCVDIFPPSPSRSSPGSVQTLSFSTDTE